MNEIWELWYPDAGATGLSFSRSRVAAEAAGGRLLVHAAPPRLQVRVTGEDGQLVAEGTKLERHEEGPMSYLVRDGREVRLEDGWPADADVGRLVLLPGGEAGILKAWWHASDRSEWRWQVEFSNHR